MAEQKDKRYCVVDHANKHGERKRVNPNRASIRAARERGVLPAELYDARGADPHEDEDKTNDC